MKKLPIYFLIIILIAGYSCTRVKETKYPSGTLKSSQQYKGKKQQGVSTWYFENGKKELEVNYLNDKPHGTATRWYQSGIRESMDTYVEGKRTGPSRKWDTQGLLIEELNYLNDSLHGNYLLYYENGQVKIEGYYNMGLYDSTWTYFDITGMKVGDGSYKNGNGLQRAFYPNGKLRLTVPYENNKRNGYEIWYNQQGKEVNRVLYKDDVAVKE